MKRYRVIRNDAKGMFFKYIEDENIYSGFKNLPKIIKRIVMKFHLPFRTLLYGEWKKNINECDTFILFDTDMYPDIIKYIKSKNRNCKIIFYYWNVINEFNKHFLNNSFIDEIWSFDPMDCKKYNLNYNPQFYSNDVITLQEKVEPKILFLGRDKGRKGQILKLKDYCTSHKIKTNFLIIEDEKDIIQYEEYLKMVASCNTLLDIIDDYHSGLTLRVMESLFLKKKLITNNYDIKNYPFYCEKNIFILGSDDLKNLSTFIQGEYQLIPNKIVEQYDYKQWLDNFLKSR